MVHACLLVHVDVSELIAGLLGWLFWDMNHLSFISGSACCTPVSCACMYVCMYVGATNCAGNVWTGP